MGDRNAGPRFQLLRKRDFPNLTSRVGAALYVGLSFLWTISAITDQLSSPPLIPSVMLSLVALAVAARDWFGGIDVDDQGVTSVTTLSTRRLRWDEIDSFVLKGRFVVAARLRTGELVSLQRYGPAVRRNQDCWRN